MDKRQPAWWKITLSACGLHIIRCCRSRRFGQDRDLCGHNAKLYNIQPRRAMLELSNCRAATRVEYYKVGYPVVERALRLRDA